MKASNESLGSASNETPNLSPNVFEAALLESFSPSHPAFVDFRTSFEQGLADHNVENVLEQKRDTNENNASDTEKQSTDPVTMPNNPSSSEIINPSASPINNFSAESDYPFSVSISTEYEHITAEMYSDFEIGLNMGEDEEPNVEEQPIILISSPFPHSSSDESFRTVLHELVSPADSECPEFTEEWDTDEDEDEDLENDGSPCVRVMMEISPRTQPSEPLPRSSLAGSGSNAETLFDEESKSKLDDESLPQQPVLSMRGGFTDENPDADSPIDDSRCTSAAGSEMSVIHSCESYIECLANDILLKPSISSLNNLAGSVMENHSQGLRSRKPMDLFVDITLGSRLHGSYTVCRDSPDSGSVYSQPSPQRSLDEVAIIDEYLHNPDSPAPSPHHSQQSLISAGLGSSQRSLDDMAIVDEYLRHLDSRTVFPKYSQESLIPAGLGISAQDNPKPDALAMKIPNIFEADKASEEFATKIRSVLEAESSKALEDFAIKIRNIFELECSKASENRAIEKPNIAKSESCKPSDELTFRRPHFPDLNSPDDDHVSFESIFSPSELNFHLQSDDNIFSSSELNLHLHCDDSADSEALTGLDTLADTNTPASSGLRTSSSGPGLPSSHLFSAPNSISPEENDYLRSSLGLEGDFQAGVEDIPNDLSSSVVLSNSIPSTNTLFTEQLFRDEEYLGSGNKLIPAREREPQVWKLYLPARWTSAIERPSLLLPNEPFRFAGLDSLVLENVGRSHLKSSSEPSTSEENTTDEQEDATDKAQDTDDVESSSRKSCSNQVCICQEGTNLSVSPIACGTGFCSVFRSFLCCGISFVLRCR